MIKNTKCAVGHGTKKGLEIKWKYKGRFAESYENSRVNTIIDCFMSRAEVIFLYLLVSFSQITDVNLSLEQRRTHRCED